MSAIHKLRKAMRRNRQQFGMFFGVSRETVRAWENGRGVPPETVQEFAGVKA
jgi:Helix-turn-helix.